MRILLVEDEQDLAKIIKHGLEEEAHHVDLCLDGDERFCLRLLEAAPYDVVLLDIMLPKTDGMTLLQRIRASGISVPIILLTAKDALNDKIQGLDTGADDYLTKPFEFKELLARIRAIHRRKQAVVAVLKVHDLELDTVKRVVRRGREIKSMTGKEYILLEYLACNKNIVLSRHQITEHIYGNSCIQESNVIDVFINSLRKKIDKDHPTKLIHTVRGVGYILGDSDV